MPESIPTEVYRFSPRTIVGAAIGWLVIFLPYCFFFAISTIHFVRDLQDFGMQMFTGVTLTILMAAAVTWLRTRPTLTTSTDGIKVSPFGGPEYFVRWEEISKIEDIRRVNVQTGQQQRFFYIIWHGGKVPFNYYYRGLLQLLTTLNDQAAKYGIEILLRSFEPEAIRNAQLSTGYGSTTNFRKEGVVTKEPSLPIFEIPIA